MSTPQGIIVFGLNGSGKTTLGRELARILGFKRMDAEDYYFRESAIPYSDARSKDEVIKLMLADIEKYGSFIMSSVAGDYGAEITEMYKLAVYITAPFELRMARVEQREHDKFGDRVQVGGDMYEQRLKFRNFVAARSIAPIEQWAETLACSVIRVDGTIDWRINAANIVEKWKGLR